MFRKKNHYNLGGRRGNGLIKKNYLLIYLFQIVYGIIIFLEFRVSSMLIAMSAGYW